jgi:starch phosphorylase
LDKSGNEFIIKINLNNFELSVKPYKLKINNTFIVLLDTNLPENGIYAKITDNLYTGSRELRLLQEITLGIGGVKALEKAGINHDILHINEGHAAFALLEKAYIYSKNNNTNINESINFLANSNVFTTHTPVIHGNEEFHIRIIRKYLTDYIEKIGLTFGQFAQFGKTNSVKNSKFSMTCLAINLSGKINAVSQLHTETANLMWEEILNKKNPKQKIVGVTNGIHINSWFANEFNDLLKINQDEIMDFEKLVSKISDIDIIKTKERIQKDMINQLSSIMKIRSSEKRYLNFVDSFKDDKKYLIFGFARRFAKYKRADLIFSNIKRLKDLFVNQNVNLRFIFSGKAHPKDTDGKAILSNLLNLIDDNNLNEFCHFIPDYDIEVGRLLVQGSDIWLNTPVKPLEACGTSGMKSALNFGINLSITDGWWYEAYNKQIGIGIEDDDSATVVCNRILDAIENEVIPLYNNKAQSSGRVNMMKNSFITAVTKFSSERMLKDYNALYFD